MNISWYDIVYAATALFVALASFLTELRELYVIIRSRLRNSHKATRKPSKPKKPNRPRAKG